MALLEGMELAELADLFHGLVGEDPHKRLELLLTKEVVATLPKLGALDGSDGPYIEWLAACDRAQLLVVLHLLAKNPIVRPILDRLDELENPALAETPSKNGVDPDWHLLGQKKVVLGRPRLRDKLKELVDGARRVALVRGERYSGKTFTHDILRDKARKHRPEIDVIYVNVMVHNTARKIAVSTVLQMGGDSTRIPANDPGASEDRASTQNWWVNQLADWVAVETRRDRALQRWLIFDGYDRVPQDPDMTQLMSALALRAIERIDDPNGFRVIFLDHPDLLPPGALELHVREDIDRITELEVLDVLMKVFRNKKPEELRPHVQEVIADANEPDTRLSLFQERLAKIVFKDR